MLKGKCESPRKKGMCSPESLTAQRLMDLVRESGDQNLHTVSMYGSVPSLSSASYCGIGGAEILGLGGSFSFWPLMVLLERIPSVARMTEQRAVGCALLPPRDGIREYSNLKAIIVVCMHTFELKKKTWETF